MKYHIIDEHARIIEDTFLADLVIKNIDGETIVIHGIADQNNIVSIEVKDEKYDSFEDGRNSEYADFIMIIERMLKDLQGRYIRTRYQVIQKRTRMLDNIYGKIPESEIEIQFDDESYVFLFAYEAPSYVEYGISKISWLDQEETGESVDREIHILESYDSLQDAMSSNFANLFLDLHEMMCNAEDFPDELFESAYGEAELPGYYQYEE